MRILLAAFIVLIGCGDDTPPVFNQDGGARDTSGSRDVPFDSTDDGGDPDGGDADGGGTPPRKTNASAQPPRGGEDSRAAAGPESPGRGLRGGPPDPGCWNGGDGGLLPPGRCS